MVKKIFREIYLFDFKSFLGLDFLNFLAHCATATQKSKVNSAICYTKKNSNFKCVCLGGCIFEKKSSFPQSWNQINQFHENSFWPNSIFCNFKDGQKSIFELGKSLKLLKTQFHEIKISIYLISLFFKFSGLLWGC